MLATPPYFCYPMNRLSSRVAPFELTEVSTCSNHGSLVVGAYRRPGGVAGIGFGSIYAPKNSEMLMNTTHTELLGDLVFPEGLRWHDGRLWFSDIHAGRVLAVDPHGNVEAQCTL